MHIKLHDLSPMKFQVAADKPTFLLLAAGLAIVFCTYFAAAAFHGSGARHESAQELVFKSVTHSHGGCSRSQLSNSVVSTEALTGFSPDQLMIMPTSFWRYESGSVRISFLRTATPCDGAECKRPRPSQDTTFGLTEVSSRSSTIHIALNAFGCVSNNANVGDSTPYGDLIYASVSYAPMERPPSLTRT